MNEVRKYRSALVSREDLGLWEGDIAPILDETKEVDIHWKGGKIPASILWECLAWFRKVNEKHSSEAQARLGYNPETGEWCWVAFPQYVVAGLYSKEIPADELTDEQNAMRLRATREMAEGGFMEAGTIHSHCDAGAFASGTDDKDEISQNGVHITLGHITSEQPEIHGRVVFRKIKYPIHWADWLDEVPADLPENFQFSAKEVSIDEERLMGLCFERPKGWTDLNPCSGTKWPCGNWGPRGGGGCSGGRTPYDWEEPEWDLPSRYGRRARDLASPIAALVDGTLEELYYGAGYDVNAILDFLGKFVQRVVEIEVYTPKEVLSEVVDGILSGRDATTTASDPERETATDL